MTKESCIQLSVGQCNNRAVWKSLTCYVCHKEEYVKHVCLSVCLAVQAKKRQRQQGGVCGLCCLARGGFYLIYLDNGTNGTYCVSMDLFIFTCARTMARILSSISSIVHIGVQFWSWLDLDHSHQYLVCRVLDTVRVNNTNQHSPRALCGHNPQCAFIVFNMFKTFQFSGNVNLK